MLARESVSGVTSDLHTWPPPSAARVSLDGRYEQLAGAGLLLATGTGVETLGEDCIDSQLDLYACAALLTCDEDIEHACHAQLETTAELCGSEG